MIKHLLLFLLLCTGFYVLNAQTLPAFSLTVTPANETCPGNGALAFSVGPDTTAGATIVYSIYLSPNFATPIATTTGNSFTGLGAGTYKVIAKQTFGSDWSQETWDGDINSLIVPLTYSSSTSKTVCTNSGVITVTINSGIPAPINAYSLYDASGTTLVEGPQTSNIFNSVPAGDYRLKVKDACGQVTIQAVSVVQYTNYAAVDQPNTPVISINSSGKLDIAYNIHPPGGAETVMAFPIIAVTQVKDPSGAVVQTITNTVVSSDGGNNIVEGGSSDQITYNLTNLNYYPNQAYTIVTTLTDRCGNIIYNETYTKPAAYINTYGQHDCNGSWITVSGFSLRNPVTVHIDCAPAGYIIPADFQLNLDPNNTTGLLGSASSYLPEGNYCFTITDAYGDTAQTTRYIDAINPPGFYTHYTTSSACTPGYQSMFALLNYGSFATATVISGPAAYSSTYPVVLNNFIGGYGDFTLLDVPSGTYVIAFTTSCGNTLTVTFDPAALSYGTTTVSAPLPVCGGFKITTNTTPDYNLTNAAWGLEMQNSSGGWDGIDAKGLSANGTFGIYPPVTGTYRIVIYNHWYQVDEAGGGVYDICGNEVIIDTFVYSPSAVGFDQLYNFYCPGGSYNLYVSGKDGVAPYTYQIISKAWDPSFVAIDNGTQNLFTGLSAGTYTAQVTDACGNTVIKTIDVTVLSLPVIRASNLCPGQPGTLSVNTLSYLDFSWTRNSDPTVLSSSNSLAFPSFDPSTDAGTYHLTITSSVPSASCINTVLDYTISASATSPNAGPDKSYPACSMVNTVNLNAILDPSADPNGRWIETTNPSSGNLTGSIWSPSSSATGVFTFNYIVDGTCSGSDTAIYTIINVSCALLSSTLNGFNAIQKGSVIDVTWATSSETSFDHFVVERSNNGLQFTPIGQLPVTGNTTQFLFTDIEPINGLNYYRLKMVNINGSSKYSQIAKVNINTGREMTLTANNPFTDYIKATIKLQQHSKITIHMFDMTGKIVYSSELIGNPGINNTVIKSLSGLTNGIYVLSASTNAGTVQIKVIKQ